MKEVYPDPAFPTRPQHNELFIIDNSGSSICFDNGSSTLNSGIFNLGLLWTNNLIYIIKLYFIYVHDKDKIFINWNEVIDDNNDEDI